MQNTDIQHSISGITALLNNGDASGAERMALFCCTRHPSVGHARFLLGVSRHMQGKRQEALADFTLAIALQPDHIDAYCAQGTLYTELGRYEEALAACQQALALAPDNPALLVNLGVVLEKLERWDEALAAYDQALSTEGQLLPALLNRGAVLGRLGRAHEALANNQQLLAFHPQCVEAYYNLSETQFLLHRYQDALDTCDTGLARIQAAPLLLMNRALALAALGRYPEAQAGLAQAQVLDPSLLGKLMEITASKPQGAVDFYVSAEVVYLEAMLSALRDDHWEYRDAFLRTLQQFIMHGTPSGSPLYSRQLAFAMLSLPLTTEHRLRLVSMISDEVMDSAWLYNLPPFQHVLRESGPIRIGYVSPDFRQHAVGHLSRQLYPLHDRQKFEVHCYTLRMAPDDPLQQEIARSCDHWHDLSAMDDVAAARKIHADGIDILIDLAGYTAQARTEIFALRPAPVQVAYLGYPGAMGADFIDYAIVDETVCPSDRNCHLSEHPVRLPGAYSPYDTETPNFPFQGTRAEFGLPEHATVFCCFSAPYKIEPDIFAVWMRLLRALPDSVLWLASRNPTDIANLRQEAQRHDITPERLIVAPHLPREQHLQRFQLADLFLDTLWHNAHTMAADALWQGLPVLTCAGEAWSSRLAASLLHALGMPELVTQSLEQYEQLALHLARNPQALAAVKTKLVGARYSAPLFDTAATVRHLEQAYQAMWEIWCAGEAPRAIRVIAD